jgi:epoxyqueuosine reductase
MGAAKDVAGWLEGVVGRHVRDSEENLLRGSGTGRIFDDPLVGFAAGHDPIFERYKTIIGDFHRTPAQLFREATGADVPAEQLTLISWILPFSESVRQSNAERTHMPSEYWTQGGLYGVHFNKALRQHVVAELRGVGVTAVAPRLTESFRTLMSERVGRASTWSERHAAYAAGLGSFGLCDGLITPKGKAVRCGSVIAHVTVAPSSAERPDLHAYCLFFQDGSCMQCAARCPVGAITERGHDKERCAELEHRTRQYAKERYGFEGHGCGLCQTAVPCESCAPTG